LGDFFTDASGRTAHRPQSTPLKTIEQKWDESQLS
jgi:hypothetical protein